MATNYDYITTCPDGLKIGNAATDKIAFYGATPVVRPTSAVAVSTSSVLSISGGTSGYCFGTTAQATALITAVNLLRANTVTLGLATSA